MKSKIEKILYTYSEKVGLYEGSVIICIDEQRYDKVAEAIEKLFAKPVVVVQSEKLGCPKCNCDMTGDGSKSWCKNEDCDFIEAN